MNQSVSRWSIMVVNHKRFDLHIRAGDHLLLTLLLRSPCGEKLEHVNKVPSMYRGMVTIYMRQISRFLQTRLAKIASIDLHSGAQVRFNASVHSILSSMDLERLVVVEKADWTEVVGLVMSLLVSLLTSTLVPASLATSDVAALGEKEKYNNCRTNPQRNRTN